MYTLLTSAKFTLLTKGKNVQVKVAHLI